MRRQRKRHGRASISFQRRWFDAAAVGLARAGQVYICFPLLLRLVHRIRPGRLWAWAAVTGLVLPFIAAAIGASLPTEPAAPIVNLTNAQEYFVYQLPPVRIAEFVFGMVLARIVMTGSGFLLRLRGAIAIAACASALLPLSPGPYRVVAIMVVPLGLLIAAAAQSDIQARTTWLGKRAMVRLGEISFAFYLLHRLVLMSVHALFGTHRSFGTPAALGITGLVVAVTLILSSLLYTLVERPMTRRFGTARS